MQGPSDEDATPANAGKVAGDNHPAEPAPVQQKISAHLGVSQDRDLLTQKNSAQGSWD
jgi:hypothetical protein